MGTDSDPVREAIDQYGPLVMRLIWRITRHEEDARDLFQETFLRFHKVLRKGEQISHPKAWVCRTALNLSLNWQRKHDQAQSYTDSSDRDGYPVINGVDAMEQHLLMDRIRHLSAKLPERQRNVFILRNFQDLSFAEIGAMLDCTPESARSNGYQALQKIRTWMTESNSRKRVES